MRSVLPARRATSTPARRALSTSPFPNTSAVNIDAPPPPQDNCSEYVLCAPLFATALCGVTTTVFLAPRDRHSRCVASAHFCFFAHLGRHNKCAFSRQCVSWFPSFAKAVAKFQYMSFFVRAPSVATAVVWCQQVCSLRPCPPQPVRSFKPCCLFAPLVATAVAYFQHLFRPDPGRHIDCVISTHVLLSPPLVATAVAVPFALLDRR